MRVLRYKKFMEALSEAQEGLKELGKKFDDTELKNFLSEHELKQTFKGKRRTNSGMSQIIGSRSTVDRSKFNPKVDRAGADTTPAEFNAWNAEIQRKKRIKHMNKLVRRQAAASGLANLQEVIKVST